MTTASTHPHPAVAATAAERKRDSLFLLARLRIDGGEAVQEVRVRNLSEGGLMAEYDRALAVDTPVSLEMRGVGTVTGRVAWREQGRVGIAFDLPIDPKAARKPVGGGKAGNFHAKAPPRR